MNRKISRYELIYHPNDERCPVMLTTKDCDLLYGFDTLADGTELVFEVWFAKQEHYINAARDLGYIQVQRMRNRHPQHWQPGHELVPLEKKRIHPLINYQHK